MIVLLDMLEVVTRDIMEDEVPSMLDSSHGGYTGRPEAMTPLDQQHKIFGKLNFPVNPETEAWREKVSFHASLFGSPDMLRVHRISVTAFGF